MIFLRGSDESHNDALARYQADLLADGPIGWVERPEVMREFLSSTFTNGAQAWKTRGTTCALFQGGALQGAGVQERRKLPTVYGITTWMKASWFSGREWIPWGELAAGAESIIRGDILYYAGSSNPEQSARIWQAAFNGHVECAQVGADFTWTTSAGGGANGRCALSEKPKDVRVNWGRHLRGLWRPNWMASARALAHRDTDPAPPPHSEPPAFLPLKRHDYGDAVRAWQVRLIAAGYELPKSTREDGSLDRDFGPEVEGQTRAVQRDHLLPQTGVVDRVTWEHAEAKR